MRIAIRKFKHRFLDPLTEFIHDSRAIGITLLSCTVLSLILANITSVGNWYKEFWNLGFDGTQTPHLHIGTLSFPNSPLLFINDFLMTFFFFLAGMEIKRELVEGEFSSLKKSLLPFVGAIGGMIVPALLYTKFNWDSEYMHGWAIPTATDIAFALGVSSLLGNRVPASLKIFLTALAIIDDLGAIVVIALFYGRHINLIYLSGCLAIVGVFLFLNNRRIQFGLLHWILGLLLWYCMFNSGIHSTVAGVIFALLIPTSLLKNLEQKFHIPVYFIVMPVFALANTAITFHANSLEVLTGSLSWGIIAGLCIGKPLGICSVSYLMVKNKFAELPAGVNWNKMIGAGLLAGIGFTMSIFISALAFKGLAQQDISKISVLTASLIAMSAGYAWLKMTK